MNSTKNKLVWECETTADASDFGWLPDTWPLSLVVAGPTGPLELERVELVRNQDRTVDHAVYFAWIGDHTRVELKVFND